MVDPAWVYILHPDRKVYTNWDSVQLDLDTLTAYITNKVLALILPVILMFGRGLAAFAASLLSDIRLFARFDDIHEISEQFTEDVGSPALGQQCDLGAGSEIANVKYRADDHAGDAPKAAKVNDQLAATRGEQLVAGLLKVGYVVRRQDVNRWLEDRFITLGVLDYTKMAHELYLLFCELIAFDVYREYTRTRFRRKRMVLRKICRGTNHRESCWICFNLSLKARLTDTPASRPALLRR